jgi:hypothetical protein
MKPSIKQASSFILLQIAICIIITVLYLKQIQIIFLKIFINYVNINLLKVNYIEMDDDISIFYEWLISNGCQFDNIDWPSYNTISGSRGAVAKCDILPNQIMLSIPYHLMLSPPNAFKDPIIGLSLHDSKDLLTGDITYKYADLSRFNDDQCGKEGKKYVEKEKWI